MKAEAAKMPDVSLEVTDIVQDDDDDDDDGGASSGRISRLKGQPARFNVNHLASFKYVPNADGDNDYIDFGMDRLLEIDR